MWSWHRSSRTRRTRMPSCSNGAAVRVRRRRIMPVRPSSMRASAKPTWDRPRSRRPPDAGARRQSRRASPRSPSRAATVTYTRDLARSFLLDGMVKEGMAQFATALKDAQTLNRPKLVAEIHQDMAIADAQLGRGTEIASHVAAAAQAGGAEDPMQIEIT